MSTTLRWLGHGGWSIETDGPTILLDPFLTESPLAPCSNDELQADYILVSHGHFDHISDVPAIAKRTGAEVIAVFEIAQWLEKTYGITNVVGMNLGGAIATSFGSIKMTPALHSSQLPDGFYGGNPVGFLLTIGDQRMYFACDTAIFSDMQLIGEAKLDLAVVPIGDCFTMGIDDSIQAIKLLQPAKVAPAHYNTWPPIAQDAKAWAARVTAETSAEPVVVEPGESFTI